MVLSQNATLPKETSILTLLFRCAENVRVLVCCGADLLESFHKPGVWSDDDIHGIFGTYGMMCLEREGIDIRKLIYDHDLLYQYRNRILIVPQHVQNSTSSTRLRQLVSRGLSISYLVPKNVEEYIVSNNLYQDGVLEKQVSVFGNF